MKSLPWTVQECPLYCKLYARLRYQQKQLLIVTNLDRIVEVSTVLSTI